MKEIILNCFTGLLWLACLAGQIFVVYVLYRSHRVYFYRKRVLQDKNFTEAERNRRYRMLPSYNRMVWQLGKFNWDD